MYTAQLLIVLLGECFVICYEFYIILFLGSTVVVINLMILYGVDKVANLTKVSSTKVIYHPLE